jgi:hypothetical protein
MGESAIRRAKEITEEVHPMLTYVQQFVILLILPFIAKATARRDLGRYRWTG